MAKVKGLTLARQRFLRLLESVALAAVLVGFQPESASAAALTHRKISATEGGFAGALSNGDGFGIDVAALGDVDGDGVGDVATGALADDDGGTDRGAVWILFLNADGSVKAQQKISDLQGGFLGGLSDGDRFGIALAPLGDLNGDTVPDVAVGAYLDDDGGTNRGAVWVLFLNADGTVESHQKISSLDGGFAGPLANEDRFGVAVGAVGDLDGDSVLDLAVGAYLDDDGGANRGAVWILFLNADGTVKASQKLSQLAGGFAGSLDDDDDFGLDVEAIGDIDGDLVPDLAVGANNDDDGSPDAGAVWLLFLNSDGTAKSTAKISASAGAFAGPLDENDDFGRTLAAPGDLDGDGVPDLAVGASVDDDGGADRGAIWVLLLNADGTVKSRFKISGTLGGFTGVLGSNDRFSVGLEALGDHDGDGKADLAAGAFLDDDGGTDRGAVYLLFAIRDLAGPYVVTGVRQPPFDLRGGPLDSFDVSFDEPIGSFTAADVSIAGPGGPISVDGVLQMDARTYRIAFPAQTTAGTYTVTIGPNVTDLAGNGLDQDRDGLLSEPSDDTQPISFAAVDVDSILTIPTAISAGDGSYEGQEVYVEATTVTIDGAHTLAALELGPGARVEHSTGVPGFDLTVTGDLEVGSGATLSADGKGFGPESGPGAGEGFATSPGTSYGTGGGFGGTGGRAELGWLAPGGAYGDLELPTDLGSGGGRPTGGRGGGALRVSVGGTLTVNGSLTANGDPGEGGNHCPGGGSGGTVRVVAGTLSGGGEIAARGGDSTCGSGGGGGGGRIALYLDSFAFTGSISAEGGSGNQTGGAGTILTKLAAQDHGELRVANGGVAGASTPLLEPSHQFDGVVVADAGELVVPAGSALGWDTADLLVDGGGRLTVEGAIGPIATADFGQVHVASGAVLTLGAQAQLTTMPVVVEGDLVLRDQSSIGCTTLQVPSGSLSLRDDSAMVCGSLEVSGGTFNEADNASLDVQSVQLLAGSFLLDKAETLPSLTIAPGATLSHSAGVLGFDLTVTGDLDVASGVVISADGAGYPEGSGPGAGVVQATSPSRSYGTGAGYGGVGGQSGTPWGSNVPGPAYCATSGPTELGSGGGGLSGPGGGGGGGLRLTVEGVLTLDGEIRANGANGTGGTHCGGGGAGGSVFLVADHLTGSGAISADGGESECGEGGGGGGGRITLALQTRDFADASISAEGGSGFQNGEAGSIQIFADQTPLQLNRRNVGQVGSPCAMQIRDFASMAGQQIRLEQIASSEPGLVFDLAGPGGWRGFTGIGSDSALLNLPDTGRYLLTARDTTFAPNRVYSYRLAETSLTELAADSTYNGTLVGSGQAQLFRIDVPAVTPARVVLTKAGSNNVTEVYARLGAPPTRADYDYHASPSGTDQQFVIPMAADETWYVLVYGETVSSPVAYSLRLETSDLLLGGVSPAYHGVSADAQLTLTGAGFDADTLVELVASSGTRYPSAVTELESPSRLTAHFVAGSVPIGTYTVSVSRPGGSSDELLDGFEMTATFGGELEAHLIVPDRVGYHAAATVWVEYANTGDVAIPAPLLVVTARQKVRHAGLLAVGRSLTPQAFWTSAVPEGYSHTVQFLAMGDTPGLLQPGESKRVPIQYAGWQKPWDFSYPPVVFELSVLDADDATPVDWPAQKAAMRPAGLEDDLWDALWANFVSEAGTTWGDYVAMLSGNAVYLVSLGEAVTEIGDLLGFEFAQADALNVVRFLAGATDAHVAAPGPDLSFRRVYPQHLRGRYALGPFGRGWSHNWDYALEIASDGTVTISEPGGHRRTYQPDSRPGGGYFAQPGDHAALTDAGGGAFLLVEADGLARAFQPDGRLDYMEDPNGNRITAAYTSGRIATLTHSAGPVLNFSYNAAGRIESITDPDSRQTTFAYDASNEHLLSVQYFDGSVVSYDYATGTGLAREHALIEVAFPGSTHQYFGYDVRGRLETASRDGGAEALTFSYDSAGRVTVTDAFGKSSHFSLEQRGLVAKVVDAAGNSTRLAYDGDGNLTRVTDPAGLFYAYEYDDHGSLIEVEDPLGNVTRFEYAGPFDRMTLLTDANGNQTAYGHDAEGNLTSITYDDLSVESWAVDPQGDPDSWTNRRGSEITYAHDSAGRLTSKVYPDTSHVDYSYDARGNLVEAVDATGTTTLEYDAADRLEKITYPGARYLQYTYDTANRRESMTDQLGHRLDYHYDTAGRLESITDETAAEIVHYTYDVAGRMQRKDLGNGVYTLYGYDDTWQLTSLVNYAPDDSVLSQFLYTYDERGRRTSMTTLEGAWSYEYDALGQLTAWTEPNGRHVAYEYDALGNRVAVTDDGSTSIFVANNLNQYAQVATAQHAYDSDGNLVQQPDSGNLRTLTYDDENRLVEVADTLPPQSWTYSYDPFGNRTRSSENGSVTESVVDPIGFGNVVATYDAGTGQLIARYEHGVGLLSSGDAGGIRTFYSFDAIGSVSETTDAFGALKDSYSYQPFGEPDGEVDPGSQSFRYAGEYGVTSDRSGNLYMRARFMEPRLGRFLNPDPIRLAGGVNSYTYARNAPTGMSDPSGLKGKQYNPNIDFPPWMYEPRQNPYWPYSPPNYGYRPLYPEKSLGEHLDDFIETVNPLLESICAVVPGCFSFDPDQLPRLSQPVEPFNPGPAWKPDPLSIPIEILDPLGLGDVKTVLSSDPNEKHGPVGYGSVRLVDGELHLSYRIDFENDAAATAPAQLVTITDQLQDELDPATFALSEVGFGDVTIELPEGLQHYEGVVATSFDGTDFEVWYEIGLHQASRELYANFYSIDPATGLPPAVDVGFLPPEDGTGRGQGHFTYVIKPLPGSSAGTEIRNVANITFDFGETIATNQVDPHDPSQGTDPEKEALNTIAPETVTLALSSTSGGSVVGPGEGVFVYDWAAGLELVAVPDPSYVFIGWSGDTEGMDDPGAASTPIVAYADFALVAQFAPAFGVPAAPGLARGVLGMLLLAAASGFLLVRGRSRSAR